MKKKTDRYDRHGKEIRVGDIIKFNNKFGINELMIGEVLFDKDDNEFIFATRDRSDTYIWLDMITKNQEVEVIGNMKDNPELLEE